MTRLSLSSRSDLARLETSELLGTSIRCLVNKPTLVARAKTDCIFAATACSGRLPPPWADIVPSRKKGPWTWSCADPLGIESGLRQATPSLFAVGDRRIRADELTEAPIRRTDMIYQPVLEKFQQSRLRYRFALLGFGTHGNHPV